MASVAKFDRWEGTNGVVKGTVLQVQSTYIDGYLAQAFTANVRDVVAGIACGITLSSATNKVLVYVHWFGEASNDNPQDSMFGLRRDGVEIGQPVDTGLTYAGNIGIAIPTKSYGSGNADSTADFCTFQYLDTPGYTNPTYGLTYGNSASVTLKSGGVYNWNTSRTTNYERGTCSMILMEIQA